MKNFQLKIFLMLALFVAPFLIPSCTKVGCPANQALYNETMGISPKEAKQMAKGNSGLKPPSKKKKSKR